MTATELQKLRSMLPYGYSSKLQKIIKKKHKKTYALITIRRGLMPAYQNDIVVNAAIQFLEQIEESSNAQSEFIKSLD